MNFRVSRFHQDLGVQDGEGLKRFAYQKRETVVQREAGAYRHRDLNVWDLDDIATDAAGHGWGTTGRLIIYAHGSDEAGYRRRLYAGRDTFKSAPDVAR